MASIVLWDECTVSPKHSLNAVDNYFRDIMNNDIPFGGKVMLLGGDWRQILPIATNADKASIVENCLKYCNTWRVFKQFSLKTNMRTLESQIQFADWLIKLGDGKLQPTDCIVPENTIEIPSQCIINNSIIDEVFGTEINESNIATMANKSILCPTNEHAIRINEEVLSLIPGQTHSYFSADKIECDEDDDVSNYTMDFVNSLTPSGMPPHQLNLKPGVIVMLLRNINPTAGLCNGSRLIVKRLMANVIDAKILIGEHKGRRVFIPRMQLSPSDANLPFQLVRRQFPFRLSFAMTINKSQGQSLETVGIYLDRPVFSHGMLYVAFSRATSIDSVRVFVKPNEQQGQILESSSRHFTQNIVFHEVFKL